MRIDFKIAAGAVALVVIASASFAADRGSRGRVVEQYQQLPMPPGFQVLNNELEGNVYADPAGKTLYTWPFRSMRAGESGDQIGKPACGYTKDDKSDGLAEPYPGGFLLPDLDKRRSCAEEYPPAFAGADAKPIGEWSIIDRPDGRKQWAHKGYPIYTAIADKKPGDVLGGSKRGGEGGRVPVSPPILVPPMFGVTQAVNGRLLTTDKDITVYVSDFDRPGRSTCAGKCLETWKPLIAPLFAESQGEWSVFERAPGVKQWAYRGRPLYTFVEDGDTIPGKLWGNDEAGWHAVYTQRVADPPSDFRYQDTPTGIVIADRRGHTVYRYNCTEDAIDQFACDRPDSPQQYRLAVCGGGDVDKCLQLFPYIPYSASARNESTLWGPVLINLRTGHHAKPGEANAQEVWAFRGQPVFTHSRDVAPGDMKGDGWGEGSGTRNGFTAFLVRDDFTRDGP
jgi:predicted lipoprotein with Yx(FWY)xxD motif